jgi:putative redox protein
MGQVQVTWVQNEQFVGMDSTKHSIVLSTAGEGTGSKPSDLLLIALGACSGVDVVGILNKKRQKFSGLQIKVSGEQDADPPWTFRKIHVEYVVRGRGLSEKAVQQAIELSQDKYCSVAATIRGVAEITSSFHIVEESND